MAPDVFVSVARVPAVMPLTSNTVVGTLVIARAVEAHGDDQSAFDLAVMGLARELGSCAAGHQIREWGRPAWTGGFTDALNDVAAASLTVPGAVASPGREMGVFRESWSPLVL